MATLDAGLLRKLADWSTDGYPVTSLYLDVDGKRSPRREDFLIRMYDLLREAGREEGSWEDRRARRSLRADLERIRRFVCDEFERGDVRGMAIFSSAGAGLWEQVALPVRVRDRVEVGSRPRLVPLEAVLERFETFCTVVADRERARVFSVRMGRIGEVGDLFDEVPGWHDRGGWAQARFQRHIKDHVQRHLKRVADALLRRLRRAPFDHLVLAGSEEIVADLERELHDYVARRVLDRTTMPITVAPGEVLQHCLRLEDEVEARREAETVERLAAELDAGRGLAAAGMHDTLAALEAGRVATLVLAWELRRTGLRCPDCGHLDVAGERCAVCGAAMRPAADLVEEAVEVAFRQGCAVQAVTGVPLPPGSDGIGALLRF
jgi:peptide chain release factor subunit 1